MIDVDIPAAPDLDDLEQREAWRIHSDREAAWALRKLAAALAEAERINRDAADEIEALKAWRDAALAGPEHDAGFFEAALVRYRVELEERDPDLPKTYKLPGGVITRRKRPDTYQVTDADAFTAWALANNRDLVKIEPRVSGLRDIVVHDNDADSVLVVDRNGEIVPGVEHHLGTDAYAAKPGA